ncbi:unnamed protein product [Boreogadus saida]
MGVYRSNNKQSMLQTKQASTHRIHGEFVLAKAKLTILQNTMQKQQHSVLFLGNAACLRLVSKPSQSLASHRRLQKAKSPLRSMALIL